MYPEKNPWISTDDTWGRQGSVPGRPLRPSPSCLKKTAPFPSYPRTDGDSPSRPVLRNFGRTGRLRTLWRPMGAASHRPDAHSLRLNATQAIGPNPVPTFPFPLHCSSSAAAAIVRAARVTASPALPFTTSTAFALSISVSAL